MELLEREPLLATLDDHLQRAATGDGSLVLVAGEAGIGKTSLARAFGVRHREQDAAVWWGACDALSTPRPLGPLYDIARAAGGDLAAVMTSEASRHDRFTALLDSLISPLRPVVAVVEDLHWADDATRDLLVYLARRVADTHALVLATYRDDEVGADHPLRHVLGHLATLPAVSRLPIPRLTEAAVATLAARHGAEPTWVHRVTAGNPFYVTEVLATGADAVPATVTDAVLARAGHLTRPARAALEAAAIVPSGAEVALLRSVSGSGPDDVDECVRAGLLYYDGQSVPFRHELARLAVARAIAGHRLPAMHAAALAHLSEDPSIDSARLAYHAAAAGDATAVLTHAPVAAARASHLAAHREAAAQYRRALDHAGLLPPAERAELLEAYAQECSQVGQLPEALDASWQALTAWREAGAIQREGRCLARHSHILWRAARNDEAHQSTRAAIALLEHHPPGAGLAAAYTYDAYLRMLARDVDSAIAQGTRAIALAEKHGDAALLSSALNAVGSAQLFTDPDLAESTLARSLAVARDNGDDIAAASAMSNLGSGAGEIRRYATADHWLAKAIEWCGQRDLDAILNYCRAWWARSALEQGRWSQAGDAASEVLRAAAMAPARIVALTVMGLLRVRRGDPDPDTPLTEAWQLAERTGDLQRLWPAAAARAEAAWLAGRPERIPDLVHDTYRLAVRLGQQWPIGELGYWRWKAEETDAAPDGAAEPYALQVSGHGREAASAWEALGCPYEAALARADVADPDQLRLAFVTFADLGAAPMTDHTAAQLRQLGVRDLPRRPTKATLANPGGPTGRELEVLALLATGATNHQVATRLHISPKTAGRHVSAILAKLHVASRHDAAAAATELGVHLR